MAPYIENPGQIGSPATDGEVPDVYNPQAKDLPASLSHVKITNGRIGVRDSNGQKSTDFKQYSIPLNPNFAFTPRKLRVFTIGAGFSGLLIAQKFQHRFPELQDIVDHTIIEARNDLGGTWLVNTYPGVQCDVPSHIYVSTETSLQLRCLTQLGVSL